MECANTAYGTIPPARAQAPLHSESAKKWSKSIISDARMKLHMAQEVILRLDEAQDRRELTDTEFNLRAKLKKRLLGWAVLERVRRKQCSRITYLREGDANTKFFHLKANGRRRKNFIQRLRRDAGWAITHEDKQKLIHDHFSAMLAQPEARSKDFNQRLDFLG